MKYKIIIQGEPKGKARPRITKTGHAYTPKATHDYEKLISLAFKNKYKDIEPTCKPLKVKMIAYFGIPKSWSKKRQKQALNNEIRPIKKPDADNIGKMVDALNGLAWHDDSQIVEHTITKWYSDKPRLEIEVEEI